MQRIRVGITMGDPAGIGPEVISKSLAHDDIREQADYIIVGDRRFYHKHASSIDPSVQFVDMANVPAGIRTGMVSREAGLASYQYLERAVRLIKDGDIQALVTAPVCKEAISLNQIPFQGHTEFLAQSFNANNIGMLFVAGEMRTIIVTRHLPLCEVPRAITTESVYQTIQITNQGLKCLFNIEKPVIGVCGLNPHAGEGGRLGDDERNTIIPAIEQSLKNGLDVHGPFASDTLFQPSWEKRYDAIVAMYHDQGLIPIKTLSMHRLVNLTLGLPFIRTSPAHGTAFDIAGQNRAHSDSMVESLKLAVQLTQLQLPGNSQKEG